MNKPSESSGVSRRQVLRRGATAVAVSIPWIFTAGIGSGSTPADAHHDCDETGIGEECSVKRTYSTNVGPVDSVQATEDGDKELSIVRQPLREGGHVR